MTTGFADELFEGLGPLGTNDADNDDALLYICMAIGIMFEQVFQYVLDTDSAVGWSSIMDLDNCPSEALDWLGMHKGATLVASASDESKRTLISGNAGMDRGSPAAITVAVQVALTDNQQVFIRERFNPDTGLEDAWHIWIRTLNSETPDPSLVEAILGSGRVIPSGIIWHYDAVDGQSWQDLMDDYPTWGDVTATFSTWDDVLTNTP